VGVFVGPALEVVLAVLLDLAVVARVVEAEEIEEVEAATAAEEEDDEPEGEGMPQLGGRVGLVITIRADNDSLKVLAPFPGVDSHGRIDIRPEERTLVLRNRRRVGTPVAPNGGRRRVILARVDRRIALDEHVKGGAQVDAVADGRAPGHVVRGQRVEADVRRGFNRGVQALKDLVVDDALGGAGDLRGRGLGFGLEFRVALEGGDGVGGRDGAVAAGLGRAGVFGVDEAAVGALFDLGGAGGGGGVGAGAGGGLSSGGRAGGGGSGGRGGGGRGRRCSGRR